MYTLIMYVSHLWAMLPVNSPGSSPRTISQDYIYKRLYYFLVRRLPFPADRTSNPLQRRSSLMSQLHFNGSSDKTNQLIMYKIDSNGGVTERLLFLFQRSKPPPISNSIY